MRDVPLGTLIFRAGLLAEEQLEDALQEGMRNGKRLGEVLLERGWLHERDLGRLLAGQKGLPFVEIRASDAEPAALAMIPEEKARLQTTLPLRYEDGQLLVAVADPSNELVIENLRRTLGSEPRLVVAPQAELIRAIAEAYGGAAQARTLSPEPTLTEEPTVMPEPTLTPEPALTPEPPLAPEPTLAQEPILAPEPTPEAEPILAQEPTLAPEPTLQPEPILEPEQPTPVPVVTPLATVLPPMEARDAEATAPPLLQPPVAEPAAEVVEQPSTVEPMTLPAPTAEGAPPPLLAPPDPQPEPEVVPVEAPAPLALPVEAQPALPEPLSPIAPLQPMVEVVEAQPAREAPPEPFLAPPAAQLPVESAPPSLEETVTSDPPVVPVEAPSATGEPASIHVVLLRLRDGEAVEVGTFQTATEASACAQDVVQQIATAEADASWPFFGERYLRPDAIVSVDLLEESAAQWLGSAVRTRWANE